MLVASFEDREGESIGLHNLQMRLKLLYGEAASLSIEAKDRGVRMTMLLPKGDSTNVYSINR
ncbi:hypothetical protein D3C81_1883320 [compost metagenome]